jgi:hypothetical protein
MKMSTITHTSLKIIYQTHQDWMNRASHMTMVTLSTVGLCFRRVTQYVPFVPKLWKTIQQSKQCVGTYFTRTAIPSYSGILEFALPVILKLRLENGQGKHMNPFLLIVSFYRVISHVDIRNGNLYGPERQEKQINCSLDCLAMGDRGQFNLFCW